jgi:hypothetical protein
MIVVFVAADAKSGLDVCTAAAAGIYFYIK